MKKGITAMLVGYARVSTLGQQASIEDQERMLLATGCTKIFAEMVSSVSERPQLEAALDFVREGDTFAVTRMDRLARSTTDLLSIIGILERKGVALRIMDFGGAAVDTSSPTGRLVITMLGAVAECERALLLDRQRCGIAKAKALGKYKGRAPTARRKTAEVLRLKSGGLGPAVIASQIGISRASVYRILADAA